jgi:hypothetical protein
MSTLRAKEKIESLRFFPLGRYYVFLSSNVLHFFLTLLSRHNHVVMKLACSAGAQGLVVKLYEKNGHNNCDNDTR